MDIYEDDFDIDGKLINIIITSLIVVDVIVINTTISAH